MYPSLSLTVCALTILNAACATPMLPSFMHLAVSDATIHSPDDTHATFHSFAVNDAHPDNRQGTSDKDDFAIDSVFAVSESPDDSHATFYPDDSHATSSPADTHATIHSFAAKANSHHGTFDKDDLISDPVAADSLYAGLGTFAHLPYVQCLQNASLTYDIAFIGAPFDSGKSSSCTLLYSS